MSDESTTLRKMELADKSRRRFHRALVAIAKAARPPHGKHAKRRLARVWEAVLDIQKSIDFVEAMERHDARR